MSVDHPSDTIRSLPAPNKDLVVSTENGNNIKNDGVIILPSTKKRPRDEEHQPQPRKTKSPPKKRPHSSSVKQEELNIARDRKRRSVQRIDYKAAADDGYLHMKQKMMELLCHLYSYRLVRQENETRPKKERMMCTETKELTKDENAKLQLLQQALTEKELLDYMVDKRNVHEADKFVIRTLQMRFANHKKQCLKDSGHLNKEDAEIIGDDLADSDASNNDKRLAQQEEEEDTIYSSDEAFIAYEDEEEEEYRSTSSSFSSSGSSESSSSSDDDARHRRHRRRHHHKHKHKHKKNNRRSRYDSDDPSPPKKKKKQTCDNEDEIVESDSTIDMKKKKKDQRNHRPATSSSARRILSDEEEEPSKEDEIESVHSLY